MRALAVYAVLLLLAFVGIHVALENPYRIGPATVAAVVLTLLLAAAPLLFHLSRARARRLRGLDKLAPLSEPFRIWFGQMGLALFALTPWFIAFRGVVRARVPAFGSRPDVVWGDDPVMFVVMVAVWIGIGAVFAWLLWKVVTFDPAAGDDDEEDHPRVDRV